MSEMTVRETIDFSARCQGVGSRAGKVPDFFHVSDQDIDTYMKVIVIIYAVMF